MRRYAKTLSAFLIFAAVSTAKAQQNGHGDPGGGPPGLGNDGGPPSPEHMTEMMDARIKKALAVADDTWATLQPLIDKVQQLAHETDSGPMMHGRPPHHNDQDNGNDQGPPPDGDENHPQSETETAVANLKKVLTDQSSTDDKIQVAMKAVQDAEKKAREDLADTRKQLRAAVNLRQQAVLVALGVLN